MPVLDWRFCRSLPPAPSFAGELVPQGVDERFLFFKVEVVVGKSFHQLVLDLLRDLMAGLPAG